MRKLITGLLLICACQGHAQTTTSSATTKTAEAKKKTNWIAINPHKFEAGIEGGPSVAVLYGNQQLRTEGPACGYSAATFFQYNFAKVISIRTNVAYERKGNLLNRNIMGVDANGNYTGSFNSTVRINLDYLTLPILVRATFGDKIKLFTEIGPYLGALLNGEIVTKVKDGESAGFPAKAVANENKRLQHFDVGLATGVGIELPLKAGFSVSFEARNNLGLYDLATGPVLNNGTIKTNSTNFLLGLGYNFGKRNS